MITTALYSKFLEEGEFKDSLRLLDMDFTLLDNTTKTTLNQTSSHDNKVRITIDIENNFKNYTEIDITDFNSDTLTENVRSLSHIFLDKEMILFDAVILKKYSNTTENIQKYGLDYVIMNPSRLTGSTYKDIFMHSEDDSGHGLTGFEPNAGKEKVFHKIARYISLCTVNTLHNLINADAGQ